MGLAGEVSPQREVHSFETSRRTEIADKIFAGPREPDEVASVFSARSHNSREISSETKWFYETLQGRTPGIELVYWGESVLLDRLAKPESGGPLNWFFAALEFSPNSCRTQVLGQLAAVGAKYIPSLHTATAVDRAFEEALGEPGVLFTAPRRSTRRKRPPRRARSWYSAGVKMEDKTVVELAVFSGPDSPLAEPAKELTDFQNGPKHGFTSLSCIE